MEGILLNEFGRERDSEEAVRQPSLGYELAEREKRQQGVCLRLGEPLSARVDILYLLAVCLKTDERTIETRIEDKRHLVRTRSKEFVESRQKPG